MPSQSLSSSFRMTCCKAAGCSFIIESIIFFMTELDESGRGPIRFPWGLRMKSFANVVVMTRDTDSLLSTGNSNHSNNALSALWSSRLKYTSVNTGKIARGSHSGRSIHLFLQLESLPSKAYA